MKAVSVLGTAAWAGLVTLVLGMQTALADPLVYVPLGGEGKIVVVDAAKDEVVDTIRGVKAVHCLAISPDDRHLIAGSFEEREAPVSPAPYHLASVRGTGKLYVSNAEQPNVWVVDQKDLVVLGKNFDRRQRTPNGPGTRHVRKANGG